MANTIKPKTLQPVCELENNNTPIIDSDQIQKELKKIKVESNISDDFNDCLLLIKNHNINTYNYKKITYEIDSRFYKKINSLIKSVKKYNIYTDFSNIPNIIEGETQKPSVIFPEFKYLQYTFDNKEASLLACSLSNIIPQKDIFITLLNKINTLDKNLINELLNASQINSNYKEIINKIENNNQKLDLKESAMKYNTLQYPISSKTFKINLQKLNEIEKNYGKNLSINELTKKLLSFTSKEEKEKLKTWLLKIGCNNEKNTTKILTKMINEEKKEIHNPIYSF